MKIWNNLVDKFKKIPKMNLYIKYLKFMENLFFLKLEIVVFILSFIYLIYYMSWKIYKAYFKVKNVIIKEEIATKKTALNKVDLNTKEKNYKKEKNTKQLTDEEINQLTELLKRVKNNSSKWYFDTAKWIIIEWLSIDKFNKDLNLELASIYIKEKNYQNAEIIYRDLLEVIKDDSDLYKKIAYIYAMQWKLDLAMDNYVKVHKKNPADEEVINMLSEISYDLKDYKNALKYINQYLKFKPRDIDKFNMKAVCFEELREFKEAIDIHKRILELQPYNTVSRDKVRELNDFV